MGATSRRRPGSSGGGRLLERHRVDAETWRAAARPVGAAAVVLVGAAAAVSGARGALGAALGALVIVAFFGSGVLASRLTRDSAPGVVMAVVMGTYPVKVALLALFLLAARDSALFDTRFFATSALVCSALWLVAQVRTVGRLRVPLDPTAADASRRPPRG